MELADSLAKLAAADDVPAERKEELSCFVSYQNMDDPDAKLGIALYVHPLKRSQRERGQIEIDVVCDYLTIETFREGVDHYPVADDSGSDGSWPSSAVEDDADRKESPLPSMSSSVRSRINGWLPLYINAQHWSRAFHHAPDAFALVATGQRLPFKPRYALDVCCKLLTGAVVGFTVGQAAGSDVQDVAKRRGKASDRAVQMYADVHRLFLQMAYEFPVIRDEAYKRLRAFIDHPSGRTKDATPDLGMLIQCLLITEAITWEHLAPSFIPEALRRHAYRSSQRNRNQHPSYRDFEAATKSRGEDYVGAEDFKSSAYRTVEDLIAAFAKFAPNAGMVSSFCVMFYHCVARPKGFTLREVLARYDRTWGHLAQTLRDEVVQKCASLCQFRSVSDVFPPMFPSGSCTDEDLAELIIWAEKHAWHGRWPIPEKDWPALDAPHPLLDAWRRNGKGPSRYPRKDPKSRNSDEKSRYPWPNGKGKDKGKDAKSRNRDGRDGGRTGQYRSSKGSAKGDSEGSAQYGHAQNFPFQTWQAQSFNAALQPSPYSLQPAQYVYYMPAMHPMLAAAPTGFQSPPYHYAYNPSTGVMVPPWGANPNLE